MSTDSQHINEKALFLRIAEGEESAFRELYRLYGRLLFPFLIKLTASQDTADEIIQEVFLRVWLYRHTLPTIDHPRAWIFKIASNQAYTWLQKNMRATQAIRLHQDEQPTADNPVEVNLTVNDIRALVQQAIAELPPQRRRIYLLQREHGLKPAEIASELGISVSTVKNTLLVATKAIREKVEKGGYLPYWLILLLLKM
ncbi:RNA polymerase sigma factor [Chitinophaga filiformis]|uniref:RNA polymerase sigma factor n=1 Tax=Chitinophaga filiformis TaxID=104663 RepID=A0A1G7SXB8_CHIFI|nr:RNA polymerase sigma factor [Chitinophaga filiformis]SDG27717.1 RNA polymerase sigma-70 factor, ECF subfamily [Chitinophaga filiformis]